MSVPPFYKWLCDRYPKILVDAVEDDPLNPFNPPQFGIDNFYLDMSGVIKYCIYPDDLPIPRALNEEDIYNNIFRYIDHLVKIVKPKKLIYFAMDGVLPRAKMDQRRAQMFKNSTNIMRIIEKKETLKRQWQEKGLAYPTEIDEDLNNRLDPNMLTPGTELMFKLSMAIQYFITERMNKSPYFKDVKCILSDSNAPGEAKHKIFSFIRNQRMFEGYNPNTSHCIYGEDSEVFMFSLATHEPHFYILRRSAISREQEEISVNRSPQQQKSKPFQFIKIPVLREYIDHEFKYLNLPFSYNLEAIIDDFVFMSIFVESDFLPHLPGFTIEEGGFDYIIYIYKRILPFLEGNLIEDEELFLSRVDILLREMGLLEETFLRFPTRIQELRRYKKINTGLKLRKENLSGNTRNSLNRTVRSTTSRMADTESFEGGNRQSNQESIDDPDIRERIRNWEQEVLDNTEEVFDKILEDPNLYYERFQEGVSMVEMTRNIENDEEKKEGAGSFEDTEALNKQQENKNVKVEGKDGRTSFNLELKNILKQENTNKIGTTENFLPGSNGYKQTYYFDKFRIVALEFAEFRKLIQKSYCEALCWVFAYYFKDCISWEWYYPFHYAPFASDIIGIDKILVRFERGSPMRPMEYLLALVPPSSYKTLPPTYKGFLLEDSSEIADLYPKDMFFDETEQETPADSETILPLIDKERILRVFAKKAAYLIASENKRNELGAAHIFVKQEHPFIKMLKDHYPLFNLVSPGTVASVDYKRGQIGGKFAGIQQKYSLNQGYIKPYGCDSVTGILNNQVIALAFENPLFKSHSSQLLEGIVMPNPQLGEEVFEELDKRLNIHNKAIQTIERALRIQSDPNDKFNRGSLPPGQEFHNSYIDPDVFKNQVYEQNSLFANKSLEMGTPHKRGFGGQGGGFYNPPSYGYQAFQGNRFSPGVNQVSFDLLQKRDRPATRSPDEQQYGDQVRKQQFK